MSLKTYGIVLLGCLMSTLAKAQKVLPKLENNHPFVVCTAQVVEQDSVFYLVPQLTVTDKKQSIQLHKTICYYPYNRLSGLCEGSFIVQKKVRYSYMNISMDRLFHPAYDEGYLQFRRYGYGDRLKDSVNLGLYYPFEVGATYRLLLDMQYYYKGKPYTAQADWVEFSIPYLPKNSIYND